MLSSAPTVGLNGGDIDLERSESTKEHGNVGGGLVRGNARHGIYERVLVAPLFRRFAEQLVTRAGLHAGESVIDVACATGIVARVARERLGPAARTVGVDVAPAMLAVALTTDSTIEWREGNASSLPVGDAERFTLLTCHQGMQFMLDKPVVVREMRRVLAPGGRAAVATWCSLEETPEWPA